MPILNYKGKKIDESELQILVNMMEESLEEHASYVEKTGIILIGNKQAADDIAENCRNAKRSVKENFNNYLNGNADKSVEEIFSETFKTVLDKSIEQCKNYGEDIAKNASTFFSIYMGDYSQAQYSDEIIYSPEDDESNIIKAAGDFKLAQEPMEGMAEIQEYSPSTDRIIGLAVARMANSNTMKIALKKQNDRKEHAEASDAEKDVFAYYSATEKSRSYSVKLMNKMMMDEGDEIEGAGKITFSDLYEAFTSINETLRMGNENGGKIRAGTITAGKIAGIGSTKIPAAMYNTLDIIAGHMNEIRKTEDPALRKTQAVQLAAFSYQMTISEHMFGDGNGRSCRILSDIILQSFGLPPHIPVAEEKALGGTIGKTTLDFGKGTNVFFSAVKQSNKLLVEYKKQEQAKADVAEYEKNKNFLKGEGLLNECLKEDSTYYRTIKEIKKEAGNARSSFHNSKEYDMFKVMADNYASLVDTIRKASDGIPLRDRKDELTINIKDMDPNVRKIVIGKLGKDIPTDGILNYNHTCFLMYEFSSTMEKCAKKYEIYKMEDHTLYPSKEPGKKLLNDDDIRKINLMQKVLGKKPLPKDLYKTEIQETMNRKEQKLI